MSTQTEIRKVWGEGESFKTGSEEKRERMAEYVEWLLTPPEVREPKTKTALAEQMGVTVQTLRNYAKESWVQRELASRARAVARVDRLPDVLDNVFAIATGQTDAPPSAQVAAARTYFDWLEKTSPVREVEVDTENMSDEELVKVALELLQRSNEKEAN